MLKRVTRRVGKATGIDRSVRRLLEQLIQMAAILVGAITALGTLGVDVSALIAGLGLTGFALGFALRDTLSNLVAGVMLLVYHPFEPGDQIQVSGFQGRIVEINLRYTVLEQATSRILIPNANMFTDKICILGRSGTDSISTGPS